MNEILRPASVRDSNFHTAEYELLYEEVGQNFRLAFNMAVYALIANGFIIAWIAQSGKDVFSPLVVQIASLVPLLLTIFAFALYRFLIWRSSIIYQYLFSIEKTVAENGLGWEHFYRNLRSSRGTGPGSRRIFYSLFLAQLALGGTFAFVVFQKFHY